MFCRHDDVMLSRYVDIFCRHDDDDDDDVNTMMMMMMMMVIMWKMMSTKVLC